MTANLIRLPVPVGYQGYRSVLPVASGVWMLYVQLSTVVESQLVANSKRII